MKSLFFTRYNLRKNINSYSIIFIFNALFIIFLEQRKSDFLILISEIAISFKVEFSTDSLYGLFSTGINLLMIKTWLS